MRKNRNYFFLLLLSAVVVFSCSKDNEQDAAPNPPTGGNPGGTCQTANMKYSTDIKAILETNCYGCHGNGLVNGGVTLDSYNGVKTVADNGKLVGVISHAAGFPQMPKGGSKLSDCNIDKIKSWIASGAPNN